VSVTIEELTADLQGKSEIHRITPWLAKRNSTLLRLYIRTLNRGKLDTSFFSDILTLYSRYCYFLRTTLLVWCWHHQGHLFWFWCCCWLVITRLLGYLFAVLVGSFIVVSISMRVIPRLGLAHSHHLLGALLVEGHLHQGGLGLDRGGGVRDRANINSHLLLSLSAHSPGDTQALLPLPHLHPLHSDRAALR